METPNIKDETPQRRDPCCFVFVAGPCLGGREQGLHQEVEVLLCFVYMCLVLLRQDSVGGCGDRA